MTTATTAAAAPLVDKQADDPYTTTHAAARALSKRWPRLCVGIRVVFRAGWARTDEIDLYAIDSDPRSLAEVDEALRALQVHAVRNLVVGQSTQFYGALEGHAACVLADRTRSVAFDAEAPLPDGPYSAIVNVPLAVFGLAAVSPCGKGAAVIHKAIDLARVDRLEEVCGDALAALETAAIAEAVKGAKP